MLKSDLAKLRVIFFLRKRAETYSHASFCILDPANRLSTIYIAAAPAKCNAIESTAGNGILTSHTKAIDTSENPT